MRFRPLALLIPLALLALVSTAPSPAVAYSRGTPFGTWEVPIGDIAGLGSPRTEVLVKAFSPSMNVVKYLDTAAAHGQKVVVYFTDTVTYSNGTIHPDRIAPWVDQVKSHPALYGYLSVKEPSWNGISLSEMRTLYQAYRAADPHHPVIALLGDIPHFGTSTNPWGTGVANILWVDWYPVTYSRGYIDTASKWFPKVRSYVSNHTPGTPIWLMVQGHGYKAGDRRTPTSTELIRQVKDGFSYLKANGIVFYTWNNALYDKDLKRNPSLWATARDIVADVRAGTFGTSSATPKPSATPTPTPTASPKPKPTATPMPKPTATPQASARPEATAQPSSTVQPSASPPGAAVTDAVPTLVPSSRTSLVPVLVAPSGAAASPAATLGPSAVSSSDPMGSDVEPSSGAGLPSVAAATLLALLAVPALLLLGPGIRLRRRP